jgi:type IV pilus assembly protein PilA
MSIRSLRRGFTLIELLLVIGIIAILAAIVIVAINPTKQLADARNAQRRSDVNTILNAVYQYSIDNNGTIPTTITTVVNDVCDGTTCTLPLVDLGVLTVNAKYLVSIPKDPHAVSPSAGYQISRDVNSRITVSVPTTLQENGAAISVTR